MKSVKDQISVAVTKTIDAVNGAGADIGEASTGHTSTGDTSTGDTSNQGTD